MAGYFSGWAEPFDTAFAETLRSHGVIPYVQIDPTDASIAGIAAGDYDDYLLTYADAVRNFGHPVIIGFGHEMNASVLLGVWARPGGHVRGRLAAHRNCVPPAGCRQRYLALDHRGRRPWNRPVSSWWPGPQYVNWVGIDGFYYKPSDTFDSVFGRTIAQVRNFTTTPVLLSETAVGPAAGQYPKIVDLFEGMARLRHWALYGSTTPSPAALPPGLADRRQPVRHPCLPARRPGISRPPRRRPDDACQPTARPGFARDEAGEPGAPGRWLSSPFSTRHRSVRR